MISRPGRSILLAMGAAAALAAAAAAQAFDAFHTLPQTPPIPADNPQSPAKVRLGKQLFFDARLSVSGAVSCNNCHNVLGAGGDGRAFSVGALGKPTARSAPTLWNAAYETVYFWDGRAKSLEAAVTEHLFDPTVMALPRKSTLVKRLDAIPGYKLEFGDVFGGRDAVSVPDAAKALAAYIRTLTTRDSAFDRYLLGDRRALSPAARRGFKDFDDVGCAACHFWVNLSGPVPGLAIQMGEGFYELFPNWIGSRYDKEYHLTDDLGRYSYDKNPAHKHMFRVPTLRNVALTAPYFHNGSVKTLEEAVRVMGKTQFKKDLTPQQVSDIAAFLKGTTGRFPPQILPRLPEAPGISVLDIH